MPYCTSQIVFTTAFMDEIIEQQSQTNPVVLQWPGCPSEMAIAGRISRPEIYHIATKLRPSETTFRAQFDGLFYVKVVKKQEIWVKGHTSYVSICLYRKWDRKVNHRYTSADGARSNQKTTKPYQISVFSSMYTIN